MADESNWMSIGEAAKYLGVSRDTLRRWEKRGKIKAIRSPTNRRYYTKKLLDEAMSAKTVGKETKKISKPRKKLKIGNTQKLVAIGVVSFIIAAILVVLLQFLF